MNEKMPALKGRGSAPGGKNKILKFPDGFLWGAATSAHQVEGGTKNDWSEWEKKNAERLAREAKTKWALWQQKKFPEMFNPENYISGRACDQYNRYEEDFDIAKSLNLNAFRISIEWSRVEPKEGKFDEKEIEHYRKVIRAIRVRGMEPFVTLWHFTNPLWVEKIGGLKSEKFAIYFSRFAKYIAERIGEEIKYFTTFNEPTVILLNSFIRGCWPPRKKNPLLYWKLVRNFIRSHNAAYDNIHSVFPEAKVGMVHTIPYLESYSRNSWLDKISVRISKKYSIDKILNLAQSKSDFIGVNYYFHNRIKFPFKRRNENKEISDLGWEIYPEGIYYILKDLKKYNLPIYITENGLADAEDRKREKFIKNHLYWILKAIEEGVDVRGYFHWSLLDNFEWDKGFWPRFGLVEVDYKTQKRKIRPSAWEYAKICETNSLIIE